MGTDNGLSLGGRRFSLVAYLAFGTALVTPAAAQQAVKPPDRPAPLARYVPAEELIFLAELDGLDAHEKAWKASAAHKLLNNTKLGALLEDLIKQGVSLAQESTDADLRIKGDDVLSLLRFIAREGFVLAATGSEKSPRIMLVLRKGDRPEVRRFLEMMSAANARDPHRKEKPAPPTIEKAGRTLHSLGAEDYWWIEKGDLVLLQKEMADSVLDTLDGKMRSAVEHPTRIELATNDPDFTSIARLFFDFSAAPALPPEAKQAGWDGVRRIDACWGVQDDALLGKLRIVAPAPRRGALKLLDQPTFDLGTALPVPPDQASFLTASLDPGKVYDQVVAVMKQASPNAAPPIVAFETFASQILGISLRNGLFPLIGPKLAFYVQPSRPNPADHPTVMLLKSYAGLTLSLQVRDFDSLSRQFGPMIESINRVLKDRQQSGGGANPKPGTPEAPIPSFRKLDRPDLAYTLEFPEGSIAPQLLEIFSPTLVLCKDQLVFSMTTKGAERVLGASNERWKPTGAYETMARRLPTKLVLLSVSDPRETLPELVANLPTILAAFNEGIKASQRQAGNPATGIPVKIDPEKLPQADELRRLLFPASIALNVDNQAATVLFREPIPSISSPSTSGMMVALLLPAVQSAREAARRIQCSNQLRQIALAANQYEEANRHLPPPAIVDKNGKPLLSWRVALLPYLEQASLYERFKLDEPWDSPNNRALLKEMPAVYRCPSRSDSAETATTYRAIVGPGAIFEPGKKLGRADISDGTSNTLLLVESSDPIEWTRPDELAFTPDAALGLLGAGSNHPNGFQGAFADGTVHLFPKTIDPRLFRNLITRSGGEKVR